MTARHDFKLICPACRAESAHVLTVEGRLLGPIHHMRVRRPGGERDQKVVPLACDACGLVSLYDFDVIEAQVLPSTTPE